MQVGDLVRVYDFTHVARDRLNHNPPQGQARLYSSEEVNAHMVGLIIATEHIVSDKHLRVLRCADGEQEYYNVNRLEVINAGR